MRSRKVSKRVLLQFPEGIKGNALKYVEEYTNKGYTVFVSAEPSFGACDIPVHDAKLLGCEKIIHFGHTKFCNVKDIDIEYVPIYFNVAELSRLVNTALHELKDYKRIGIITNISHVKQLNEIKRILTNNGKHVFTARGSSKCPYESQILGCDITALEKIYNKIECLIYFGGGRFHAIAPSAFEQNYTLPTLWIDPFSKKVEWITEQIQRVQKQRRIALARALEANVYGILVSTKIGQYNITLASKIKEVLNSYNKKSIIIIGNTFDFVSLSNFTNVDAFINTACPRIVDDQNKLSIPIVNGLEFLELLKIKTKNKK